MHFDAETRESQISLRCRMYRAHAHLRLSTNASICLPPHILSGVGRQSKTYRRINKSKIIGVESQEIEADTYQSIAFLEISEILTFLCGGAVNIIQCSHAPNLLSLRAAERNGTTEHLFY